MRYSKKDGTEKTIIQVVVSLEEKKLITSWAKSRGRSVSNFILHHTLQHIKSLKTDSKESLN